MNKKFSALTGIVACFLAGLSPAPALDAVVIKRDMIQFGTKFIKTPFGYEQLSRTLGRPSRGKGHFLYWDRDGFSFYDDRKKETPTRIMTFYLQDMPGGVENPDHPVRPYGGSLIVSGVNLRGKIDPEKMRQNGFGRKTAGVLPFYYYRGLGYRVNVIMHKDQAVTVTIQEE